MRCAAGKRAIEAAHGLAICILGIGYIWFMYVSVKVIFHDRMLCLELQSCLDGVSVMREFQLARYITLYGVLGANAEKLSNNKLVWRNKSILQRVYGI